MAQAFLPFRFSAPCLVVIVALSFMSTGCGSKHPGLVQVDGTVTLDGNPVTSGSVVFYPESGRPARSEIDKAGHYNLSTYEKGDGAKPGKYIVTITSNIINDNGPVYKSYEDEMNGTPQVNQANLSSGKTGVQWIVPQRYSNRATTDLQEEITPEGGEIDFVLNSK